MGMYDTRLLQAVENVGRELKLLRRAVENIDKRLSSAGGLTAATTRRAHLVVDGDKKKVFCSACGAFHGNWWDDVDVTLANYGEICDVCGATLRGDEEYISGSGSE